MRDQNGIDNQTGRMNQSRKATLASSIGTFVEWAEFSFYGYLAFKFANLFF